MNVTSQLRYITGFAAVTLIAGSAFTFSNKVATATILTRFGSPTATTTTPGLHFKLPWPIDQANSIDLRRRVLSTPKIELLTRDKKNIVLMTSAVWRPSDPLMFFKAVGTIDAADDKLRGLVTNAQIAAFGRHDLSALVSTDETTLKVATIEGEILEAVNQISQGEYGIEVLSIGFRRVSLPEENVRFVFEQMRAERQQHAAVFRAEGELQASKIRTEADLEAARIRAEGEEAAARILGTAEAEAAAIYAEAHGKDPDFYQFLRSLESLDRVIGEKANVTLRTDAEPFHLLKESGR